MTRMYSAGAAALALAALAASPVARAQVAVSANDGKVELVDGAIKYKADGKDTITILDIGVTPVKVIAEIPAPASVVGPPFSVAITPSGELALVTAAKRTDGDPPKEISDDQVTVIDLKKTTLLGSLAGRAKALATKSAVPSSIPEVIATLHAGKGAAGVAINKTGTLALVANRDEGSVSVFTIAGKTVAPAGKVELGDEKSSPCAIVFTPDGNSAFVTLDGTATNQIAVLSVDGTRVEFTKRKLTAGVAPYGIVVSPKGDIAIVANMGGGRTGDADTVSIIDLKSKLARVVNTVPVAPSPEGLRISPDGQYLAVASQNGSNRATTSPYYNDGGMLAVFRVRGTELQKVTQAPTGHWCQGVVWSARSNRILVQCMVEREIQVFTFTGGKLEKQNAIKVSGGPAGIGSAEK